MKPATAVVVYALDRSPTGIGSYTRGLLAGMKALDWPLLILQSGNGDTGNETIRLPGAGLLPALLTLGQAEIGWYTRRHDLALVHDPTGTAPLALCPARRVVTIHDVFPLSFPGHSTALETLIYRYWLPSAVRRVDMVLTDSTQSKQDIQQYLGVPEDKIGVISLAAEASFRVLPAEQIAPTLDRYGVTKPYVLYVGSLEPRKNLLRLLKAYAILRQGVPDVRLAIVGARNYWKSSPVAAAVQQQGLGNWVTFTGYVQDDDLPALYNGAELLCFPSLYEGFGLPVLEAMACGTPVVTSNTSSLPEVAGEAGLLVDPYDVEAISAAMQRVLSEPELAADLRQRGLKRAAQFTWEKTARETIAVYERVLGEKLL